MSGEASQVTPCLGETSLHRLNGALLQLVEALRLLLQAPAGMLGRKAPAELPQALTCGLLLGSCEP